MKMIIYYTVVLIVAPFFILTLSNFSGESFAASKALKEDKVLSRECKMLLLPEKFADMKPALKDFWHIVEKVGSAQGLKIKKIDGSDREYTKREVSYLDTEKFDLYKNSYILRRRVEDGDIDITLKFRNPDVIVSSKADVCPRPKCSGKTVMEEDVVVKGEIFEHMFSKSGKTILSSDPEATIGSYSAVYPGIMRLGLPEKTQLRVVNGVKIKEIGVEYGNICLTKNITAKASFAIWYVEGEDAVFAAEFSYKYKYKDSPSKRELTLAHEVSDEFFRKLRDGAKLWIATGLTKTGMVYKFNASNAD